MSIVVKFKNQNPARGRKLVLIGEAVNDIVREFKNQNPARGRKLDQARMKQNKEII